MKMSEQNASHSVDAQETSGMPTEVNESIENEILAHMEAFGIQPKQESQEKLGKEEAEEREAQEEEVQEEKEEPEASPAKTYRVKFNKEEVEIEPERVPELLQKGLAL